MVESGFKAEVEECLLSLNPKFLSLQPKNKLSYLLFYYYCLLFVEFVNSKSDYNTY